MSACERRATLSSATGSRILPAAFWRVSALLLPYVAAIFRWARPGCIKAGDHVLCMGAEWGPAPVNESSLICFASLTTSRLFRIIGGG